MGVVTPGFQGRARSGNPRLPPGQYLAEDFPVLSAGPTPRVRTETWEFKLDTRWRGVSIDTLVGGLDTEADYVMVHAYGGYTTNLPLADLLDGQAWIAYEYGGKPLTPEHGGPARLLVPHLYFWKSAKWVRGLELKTRDEPGFWENAGYHDYGDPWREQRYQGD
jgi:DMSO/TMAO reductase YedYZ molybdopterin-dependent catalytic subunit